MKIFYIMLLLATNLSFANYDTGSSDPDSESSFDTVSSGDDTSSDPDKMKESSVSEEEDSGYQTGTFTD